MWIFYFLMKNAPLIRIAGYSGFILVLIYLFYFLKKVDVSLIYYWQQSVPLSFGESIRFPGGLSDLLGDWFLELLTFPFWGSVAVALLVLTVFLSLHVIFRQEKTNPAYFALMLAALIPFILLFTHYRFPAGLILSFVTGLLLAAIQSLYAPRKLLSRSILSFITGMIVYLVSGVAGLIVLFLVILIQSKKSRDLISALPPLIIPLLYMPFDLSNTIKSAYLGSFLISEFNVLSPVFYFTLGTPLLLFATFTALNHLFSKFPIKRPLLLSGISITLVIVMLALSSNASFNEREKDAYTIVRAGLQKDVETVIELTGRLAKISNLEQFEFNRALYRSDQFLEKLFQYPQPWGEKGLFLEGDISCPVAIHISDFNLELGFANETRHWATEAQMGFMRHPIVLKNLVISYLAMGKTDAALKYLNVLSGSRLYREWCDQIQNIIETDKVLEDPRIQAFLANNPEVNFFCSSSDPTRKILDFFNNNPDNHMAFEYLIGSYLMQHEVGKVVSYLPKFKELGYKKLPRSIEEALMIYATSPKADLSKVKGYSASPETLKDFRDLSKLMSGEDARSVKKQRAIKYENTYWYYILFTSPYASKK